jgi:cytochrome d ubiquinol oxidase subunit II
MIEIVWFCLVAIMIAGYVVLDGFDLGAGIIHLLVARTEQERGHVLSSIGPVWDGNEVWLVAGGGTLYFAFPALYSAAFSGFYLALMVVLWLLILRGIAIELRRHIESSLWRPFWDLVFGGSSALLALLYGAALGNVVRGVPLDSSGFFFIPLWTNPQPGPDAGIVDWYTLLIGSAAFHGAGDSRLLLDGFENERRFAASIACIRRAALVCGCGFDCYDYRRQFSAPAQHCQAVFRTCLGIRVSSARARGLGRDAHLERACA